MALRCKGLIKLIYYIFRDQLHIIIANTAVGFKVGIEAVFVLRQGVVIFPVECILKTGGGEKPGFYLP